MRCFENRFIVSNLIRKIINSLALKSRKSKKILLKTKLFV